MDCFRRKQRDYFCCIKLLDETEISQDIQRETRGSVLLDLVYKHLNLLEVDYFGLRYLDSNNQTHWLESSKPITRQITNGPPYTLYFGVKFYIEDPCQLKEEITCYQFFLQLKQDMLRGRLPCNFSVAAELCGYILQSELGDYDRQKHQEGHVSEFRFIPNQTEELEQQIKESHIALCGQTPALAEKNFLERAKWLDMYGVDLHPVRGEDQVDYYLGLTPTGVVVYKGKNKVSVYYWQRVVRVHYREREFVLTTKNKEGLENEYIFEVEGKAGCKHLWKCCVEQHSFFRLPQMTDSPSDVQRQPVRSPKYRQNAKTQKEAIEISQDINRPPQKVHRVRSRRYAPRSAQQSTKGRSPPDGEPQNDKRGQTNGGTTVSKAPEPTRTPHQHRRSTQESKTSTAPWEGNEKVGLYTAAGASPVSVRSVNSNHRRRSRSRSPGANSYRKQDTDKSDYSGNESESSRRHRHKHRSGSESEGEHQHHHRHRRRRSASRGGDSSGSESEHRHKKHQSRRRRRSSDRMVDSQAQWEYIQQAHQNRGEVRTADDIVVRNLRNGNLPITPTPEQRMWRRARSHSGDRRASRELKKHIEYGLIDTEHNGDPYDIPYKNIVTSGVAIRVSKSPLQPRKRSRSRDRKRLSQSSIEGEKQYEEDEDKFITLSVQQPTVTKAQHKSSYEPPYSSPTHQPKATSKNGPPPPYPESSPRKEKHRNGEIRVVSGPVPASRENGGRVPDVANVGERGMFGRQQEEKLKKMNRNGKDQDTGSGYYSASVYRVEIDTPDPNPYLLRQLDQSFHSYLSQTQNTQEKDNKNDHQRLRCDSGVEESDNNIFNENISTKECDGKYNTFQQECMSEDSLKNKFHNTLQIHSSNERQFIRGSHDSIVSECSSGRGSIVESLESTINIQSSHSNHSEIKLRDLNKYMMEILKSNTSKKRSNVSKGQSEIHIENTGTNIRSDGRIFLTQNAFHRAMPSGGCEDRDSDWHRHHSLQDHRSHINHSSINELSNYSNKEFYPHIGIVPESKESIGLCYNKSIDNDEVLFRHKESIRECSQQIENRNNTNHDETVQYSADNGADDENPK